MNQALLDRWYKHFEDERFRRYSRGWFQGFIIVPDTSCGPYGKRYKRVNPRINTRYYDFVSAYPYRMKHNFGNIRVGDMVSTDDKNLPTL